MECQLNLTSEITYIKQIIKKKGPASQKMDEIHTIASKLFDMINEEFPDPLIDLIMIFIDDSVFSDNVTARYNKVKKYIALL